MTTRTSYTNARANLAKLCDKATDDRETVIIERRGAKDVALISAEELAGLEETAHLLRSPKNAQRLLAALARSYDGSVPSSTVAELRRELGLEETS
ncbi:MAG: type II toxin-antitoxin system Phd/YefM family antitoxin [Gemmatimonadota bacterium]